jgi:transcriptional repressor NrdR
VAVQCPNCSTPDTAVVDSREADEGLAIRRRRQCNACGHRFTTFERAESARIQVVKRDGSREEFDRAKLASSISKAAGKSLSVEKVTQVVNEIEVGLKTSGASEVESPRLGELVLERLEAVDPMAYIRFRIVYANLHDIDALQEELARLTNRRERARERAAAEQQVLPIADGESAAPQPPRRRGAPARRR